MGVYEMMSVLVWKDSVLYVGFVLFYFFVRM